MNSARKGAPAIRSLSDSLPSQAQVGSFSGRQESNLAETDRTGAVGITACVNLGRRDSEHARFEFGTKGRARNSHNQDSRVP